MFQILYRTYTKNYVLLIWNSNLTGHVAFLSAEPGTLTLWSRTATQVLPCRKARREGNQEQASQPEAESLSLSEQSPSHYGIRRYQTLAFPAFLEYK